MMIDVFIKQYRSEVLLVKRDYRYEETMESLEEQRATWLSTTARYISVEDIGAKQVYFGAELRLQICRLQ